MKNYYDILGVAKTATEDDIKKAYRKLAMDHHPDRGGDTAKFQEIKEAYENLSDAKKRAAYDNPGFKSFDQMDINEIHRQMREHMERNMMQFVTVRVSIEKAFNGCKIPLYAYGQSIGYQLRAGLPQGVSFEDQIPVGDKLRRININLLIESDKFKFVRPGSDDGVFFSGDLVTQVEVDALTILLGGYTIVEDFLGKKLQVRIPGGFDLGTRLKVAKHGYSNWRGETAAERGDLYLQVVPKFKPLKDADPTRLEELITVAQDALQQHVTKPDAVTD